MISIALFFLVRLNEYITSISNISKGFAGQPCFLILQFANAGAGAKVTKYNRFH